MAEMLISAVLNWMDKPSVQNPELTGYENLVARINSESITEEERAQKLAAALQDYNSRYVIGDIIEFSEDDKYSIASNPSGCGWNRSKFALIIIKNYNYKELKGIYKKSPVFKSKIMIGIPVEPGIVYEYNNINQLLLIDKDLV